MCGTCGCKSAETLSKTSCCCGADEANPCVCMKAPEPMECSAKAPKCACYKALEKNAEYDEEDMVSCRHCWNVIGNEKEVYGDETVEYEMANGELVCVPCYKEWMEEYKNDLDPHYSPFYAETQTIPANKVVVIDGEEYDIYIGDLYDYGLDDDGTASVEYGQRCEVCDDERRGSIGGNVYWDKNAESFESEWVIEAVQQNLNDKDFVNYAYKVLIGGDAKTFEEKSMAIAETMNQNANNDDFTSFVESELFNAEESSKGLPWMTFAFIGLGAFVASRIKTIGFKADGDCGCGCSGKSDCGDEKKADEGHYPNTYDPVQDFLPRYRYPEDSDWSNSYNPADPYRPLDYQTVQTDSRTTADRM